MKLIGIEEHFITAEVHDAWHAIALEAIHPSVAFHAGATQKRLFDLADKRLALMDELSASSKGRLENMGLHTSASAVVAAVGNARDFKSGRELAA